MSDSTSFRPHAIIVPERSRPSPVLAVCVAGVDFFLRIDFSDPHNPGNFVREALTAVRGPKWASPFGRAMGFVINYCEDCAVRFDLAGNPVACSAQPLRAGQTRLTMKGKSLSGVIQE